MAGPHDSAAVEVVLMRLGPYRVGAVAWIVTGLVHDVLEFVLPGDPALDTALRASRIDVGPAHLAADSLMRGVSVAMGLAMVVVGVLLLMIGHVLRDHPRLLRPFEYVAALASVLALGVAICWVPGPPLITFTVATAAFATALLARRVPAAEGVAR